MADVKIQDLLATTTVADNDLFIVEDNADTKKITKANLVSALGIDTKASKGSGSATSLTLVNGWVGNVRCRLSEGGIVTIEIDVAHPTNPAPLSQITTIPPGMISNYEKVVQIVAPATGIVDYLYINAAGLLRPSANSTLVHSRSYHGAISYGI